MTENEIFEFLKKVLTDYFEIDESKITMEANLNEDLDMDSIDAIDMIIDIIMKQMNNNENN